MWVAPTVGSNPALSEAQGNIMNLLEKLKRISNGETRIGIYITPHTCNRLSIKLKKIKKQINSILDYSPYNLCLGGDDANKLEEITYWLETIIANTTEKQL